MVLGTLTDFLMTEWDVSADAASHLASLSDSDLHLLVRSLPWDSFLLPHLLESDLRPLRRIVDELGGSLLLLFYTLFLHSWATRRERT